MGMAKFEFPLTRVNVNLPTTLVDKVKFYATTKGLNYTTAYTVLLNQALTTDYLLDKLPELVNLYSLMESSLKGNNNDIDTLFLKNIQKGVNT